MTSQRKNSRFAVALEVQRVSMAWLRHATLGFPLRVLRSVVKDPSIDWIVDEARVLDLLGEATVQLFSALGPIYGKAGQIALSRLSPKMQQVADGLRLTRLYGDWPPMPFEEVEAILDKDVPRWRENLKINHVPLGVASLGQVHQASDRLSGDQWAVKVIRPQARRRLLESVDALEQVISVIQPLAVTLVAKRMVTEMQELCAGFKRELDLELEAQTIQRVAEKMDESRKSLLRIPKVYQEFSTKNVLTLEYFSGIALSEIIRGKVELNESKRKKLAKKMLQELLVQVFEVGLFHADPHAGNLILLDDGSVGLFDWGLAGELLESDRRHIAGMLKAVIAQDLDRLIAVLQDMAKEAGKPVSDERIRKELTRVIRLVKRGQEDASKKPSLQELIEHCLRAAARLGIPVPTGLLLMAKSLITIEGLARGIDPKVSLARIATPVLFRAAKPTLRDFVEMGRRFPKVAKSILFK